ncbi:PAS domain S-box-containing protein [Cyclonatronum proteinivorum]|uniref:PAS domain S-box-containing protein n=1 Tax=Cyclonatronum proteinivorum TaxID=1457365 RepID=A0A345UHD0_9BACT|nr:PAS domain S-box protein [Cyclonatronum proteinivorum]AXI99881.1 PAS domain S-box-containing protein [Cyclonatronum proteinivorum]
MGKSASENQLSGLISKLLKGEEVDYEQFRDVPVEQIIEQLNIYHQELEYQNQELVQARTVAELSEARFKDLFQNAPFGYIVLNADMVVSEANTAASGLLGKNNVNLKGTKVTDYIQAERQDDFYFCLRRLKEKPGSEESFEFRVKADSVNGGQGKELVLFARLQFMKDAAPTAAISKAIPQYRMLIVDITAEKKQEERLTSLLNNLPVGVVAADPAQKTIAFCNQTMCDMLGLNGAQLMGRSLVHFHPEKEQARAAAEYDKGRDINISVQHPFALKHASGRLIYATVTAVELDLFGNTYWCGVYSEVTDHLENLHKRHMFQDIVDNTSDFVGTATLDGQVIYVNQTFSSRLGYDIETEVLGEHIIRFHPQWVQDLMKREALPQLMEEGMWKGDTVILSKDGKEIPVSQLMIRHDKPDGSADFISTSLRDMSDRQEIDRLQVLQQQEKEAADARIRREQRKMELILSQAPDGVISVDGERRIQFLNKVAQRMFGIEPKEVKGKNIDEVIPHLSSVFGDMSYDTLKNLKGHDLPLQDLNGNPFWGQVSVSVVDFEDELYYTLFIRDVTERKQNEELLIRNTRRLNEIALNSRTIAWEIDAEGVYTFISPVCETMLGYRVSEVVGHKTLFDLHPAEGRSVFEKKVRAAFLQGKRFTAFYNKVQTKDGHVIWVSTNGVPVFDADGKLKGYRGSDTDVTDLIEAEQRNRLLQKAVESSTVGIVLADMTLEDQPLIYINPAFQHITGYHPDEVIGKNCRFLQGDDTLQDELNTIRKAIREGNSCRVTLRNYRKNGKLFWNQLSLSPIYDENNTLTHFVGVQQDITKLKEAENSLKRQNALQSFLLSVSARFVDVKPDELNQVVSEVLGESAELIHADRLYCAIYTDDRDVLQPQWLTNDKGTSAGFPAVFFEDYQSGKTLFIHNTSNLGQNHPLKKWLAGRGVCGLVAMPLMQAGTCTGFLIAENLESSLFLEKEHLNMMGILIQLLVNLQNRMNALGQLSQSEEKFAMAFQSSPYAIAISEPDSGRLVEVNSAFYQYTGYTPDDVRHDRVTSLNVWARKKERLVMTKALKRGQKVENMQFEFRKKNGEIFTGLLSSRIIHIDNKPYYITSISDISERIAAQQKLAESEEKYRLLFAANKDAITVFSLDTENPEILETNAAAEELTGYPLDELKGMPITMLETGLTAGEVARRAERLYDHAEVNYETRIRTKSGEMRDLEVKAVLVFYEDKPGYMTISRDITRRKKDEKKLRNALLRNQAMFAALPDMMFLFDNKLEIIDYNAADEAEMIADPDFFSGKGLHSFMPSRIADEANQVIRRVLDTGNADTYTYSVVMGKKRRYYEARFVACGTDQVMAVVRDITDAKEAEREILRFSRLIEGSINEIYLFTPGDYRFQVMNPAALRNLGYEAEDVENLDVMKVANVTQQQLNEALKPLYTGEQSTVIMEAKHFRKDGSSYDVQSYIQLITYEDEQLFAGIVVDITERLNYLRYLENQNKVLRDISWTQSHLVRAPLARMMSLIMLLQEKDFETFSEEDILQYLSDSAREIDDMIHQIADKTENTVFRNTGADDAPDPSNHSKA